MKPIVYEQPSVSPQLHSIWPALPTPVRIPLTQLGEHRCPYLPEQTARDRAFLTDALPPRLYHGLMDAGFRRSGKVVYQPTCKSCRACRPVRVRVGDFLPSKSQRRTLRRNADLKIEVGPLEPTEEKFDLYCRYQSVRHGERDHLDWSSFVDFLYDSPVDTVEFTYRGGDNRLLGVGICDECEPSLSSVYFYFDPLERRRGLGTFGVLREIEYCRDNEIPNYYLGFWIRGCDAMRYKTTFRPYQELGTDGLWRDRLESFPPGSGGAERA